MASQFYAVFTGVTDLLIMERRKLHFQPGAPTVLGHRIESDDNRTQFTLSTYSISVANVPLMPSYTSVQPESLSAWRPRSLARLQSAVDDNKVKTSSLATKITPVITITTSHCCWLAETRLITSRVSDKKLTRQPDWHLPLIAQCRHYAASHDS